MKIQKYINDHLLEIKHNIFHQIILFEFYDEKYQVENVIYFKINEKYLKNSIIEIKNFSIF